MSLIQFFGLLLTVIPFTLSAQTYAERVTEAYNQTDKNYDLDCSYSYNKTLKLISPVGETIRGSNFLSREFIIDGNDRKIPLSFTLSRRAGSLEYEVRINEIHISKGKLQKRDFYIAPIKDQTFAAEFETAKISCSVNFAYAYPFVLNDGNYHISVHPHRIYDWQKRLKNEIEKYLADQRYISLIMLETGNYRGNLVNINSFFDGADYKLPIKRYDSDLENVPLEVPLIVSPAGNSRFDIRAKNEINITFTGGNHNYCIWNVTRHVIENLLNSNSEARVNFYYDTKTIVAQTRGIEGEGLDINFSRNDVNRSNLLIDLLAQKEVQARYHASYLQYFRDFLGKQFSGMFKTYKINYKAEGFEKVVVIEGRGTRNIEVNLIYL